MDKVKVTFDNLPEMVGYLIGEVSELKSIVVEERQEPQVEKERIPIDITAAARLLGKAKPTLYAMAQKRKIPCYKRGKNLYFFKDELLDWIVSGKKKTILEIEQEAELAVREKKGGRR